MVEVHQLEEGILSVPGFRATGVSCGLKTGGFKDISLLLSETPCNTAMAFTKNKIQGSHIAIDKARVGHPCQALIVNSGNANCLTGQEGLDNAQEIVELTGSLLKIDPMECLVASTGTIGIPLNMNRVKYGIDRLVNVIQNETNIRNFCSGIATSDTRHKNIAYKFKLGDDTVIMGATAKGESMVKPWFETMQGTILVIVTTNANITSYLLQKALASVIDSTINRISIDNDISPNDSIFVLANGTTPMISEESDPRYEVFVEVLKKVILNISKLLLKQGLGTSRLLHIEVQNAPSMEVAERLVRAIGESYQVKTGFSAQKIPWQKIINVISSHVEDFDLTNFTLAINNQVLFKNGQPDKAKIASCSFDTNAMECSVVIDLNNGTHSQELWTCDLTHDYLKFNSFNSDNV